MLGKTMVWVEMALYNDNFDAPKWQQSCSAPWGVERILVRTGPNELEGKHFVQVDEDLKPS